jgi:urea transporter
VTAEIPLEGFMPDPDPDPDADADPDSEPSGHETRERRELSMYLLDSLRGIGQAALQLSVLSSVVILGALFVGGWRVGLFATIGTLVGTGTSVMFGISRKIEDQGLEGFNGALVGIAMITFLGDHMATYLLAIGGAVLSTVVSAGLTAFFAPYRIGALAAPFCVVAGSILMGAPYFARAWYHPAPAAAVDPSTRTTWHELWHAFFTNVSQIFLVDSWQTGLIIMIALGLASREVLAFTVMGSILSTATAVVLGAPSQQIGMGLYGYNGTLVAVAMGAMFLRRDLWNAAYALIGAVAATFLTASTTALWTPLGGKNFSWGFIVTTWLMLLATHRLRRFSLRT